MRLPWRRARERKSSTKVLGLSDSLGKFFMLGEGLAVSPTAALALYEQSSAVSVPVNMVADPFAVVRPVLFLGKKMVDEHPVLDLLRRPSPYYTTELFLETVSKNYLVTGEFAVVALGNVNNAPLEIQPLSPKSLTPTREELSDYPSAWQVAGNTLSGRYALRRERGGRARFLDGNLRELLVVRNYSTRDNSLLRGQSPLLAASREARSHVLGTEHNVTLLERGGRVSLVFHFEEDLGRDEYEDLKERVQESFAGPSKAGEIAVTTGGKLTIKEMGVAPKDLDFRTLQAIAQKACALQYHVPLPLITDERQTLSNYREGKLALYDDAVLPLARRVLGGLSDFLLPKYGVDPTKATLGINPDDVTPLVQRRNDEMVKRKKIAVETDNELRALIGREPLEGGDVLFKPATMVPAGTDLFTDDEEPNIVEQEDGV